MKIHFTLTLIMALALLSGCATGKRRLTLDTVGPAQNQTAISNATNGTLVVYSTYQVNADFAGRDCCAFNRQERKSRARIFSCAAPDIRFRLG